MHHRRVDTGEHPALGDASAREPEVLSRTAQGCSVLERGAIVSIRRAPIQGAEGANALRGIERAAALHPPGTVLLSVFRLSPRFPIAVETEMNLRELAETLRSIDRHLVANAVVLEFGGVRAAAMRLATRAVWSLARPRAVMSMHDRLSDAISWLLPHARAVGAPDDAATYVRLYRLAERGLDEVDAAGFAAHAGGRAR